MGLLIGDTRPRVVRAFLSKQGILPVSERLGGKQPREIFLRTDTAEVFVRAVDQKELAPVERAEAAAWSLPVSPEPAFAFDPDSAPC